MNVALGLLIIKPAWSVSDAGNQLKWNKHYLETLVLWWQNGAVKHRVGKENVMHNASLTVLGMWVAAKGWSQLWQAAC